MLDNLEDYADPNLYDAEYGRSQDDFDFYLPLIKTGSVLDLACGTGRLAIPFAQKGFKVVGLDASHPMLVLARSKSKNLSIEWIQGDMRHFQLSQKFDLITMAGNAFQALLTDKDQERLLLGVSNHLKQDGIFAFNTRNPRPDDRCTIADFEFWHDFKDPEGQLVKVYGRETYNPSKDTVRYTTQRIWPDDAETITDIELRFTKAEELIKRLEKSGFEIISLFGDFSKSPFTTSSESIIVLCRLKNVG